MNKEEKDLLLRDLCARLPYHLRGKSKDGNLYEATVIYDTGTILASDVDGVNTNICCGFKPYLRPISSMTAEEVDSLFKILRIDEERGDWLKVNDIGVIRLFTEAGKDFYEIAAAFDYLNSIHVDYRGLIGKGLALEAPEGMYETKTEQI